MSSIECEKRKHRKKVKTETVKGEPGVRDYRHRVEEQVYGNYAFASEQAALALCAARANNIRIRHQRGTSPRQAAAEIAEMHDLVPLKNLTTVN